MSYITFSSEQITSKNGELSIDVFSNLDKPDDSKLLMNCNSYLNDGIKFNCPNGGIKLESKDIQINNIKSKLQSKNITLETVDLINLYSLSKINISALSSISLSNEQDGFFYNIDENFIKIVNNEEDSKLEMDSQYINIGSDDSNILFNSSDYNISFKDKYNLSNGLSTILMSNNNIELIGDVYIRGTLKFDKLETAKVKKLKLDDISNNLEFGNKDTSLLEWKISGIHLDTKSEMNYNNQSNTFSFKRDTEFSNLKAGGLCINNGNDNILYTDGVNTKVIKLTSKDIVADSLRVSNKIYCSDLEINGKKIVEHLNNIVSNNDIDVAKVVNGNDYALICCDINQNIFIDKNELYISGYYKNIIWDGGKINLRNINKFSVIKNIIFRNCTISLINCSKLKFEQCIFENTELFCNNSDLTYKNTEIDLNCKFKCNNVHIIETDIDCDLEITHKVVIKDTNIKTNAKLRLLNNNIIYHITNNFIFCRNNINEIIISNKDLILVDNWINYLVKNESAYEKNIVVSSEN